MPAHPKPPPKKGSSNRSRGLRRQGIVRRKIGIRTHHRSQLTNEENWRADWAVFEVKSGKQVPAAIRRVFDQALAARATGDPRPPLTVWAFEDDPDELVVCYLDDLLSIIANQGPHKARLIRDLAQHIARKAYEIEEAV